MVKKLTFLLCLGLGVVAFTAAPALALNFDIRISNGNDDAEEHLGDGSMDITSTDLELPYEDDATPSATDEQLIGLRFTVPVPQGAQVKKAYVEFEMDEAKGNDRPVNLIIEAQLVANAPAISSTSRDLSSRAARTKAQVKWTVPLNLAVDTKFQSPDISAIINEIISQTGWASGNALLILIRDDKSAASKGIRCTEAVEGESTAAVLLHLEIVSPFASEANPANGATGVTTPLFSWTAGDGAVFHNVYLGTTPNLTEANLVAKNQPFAMYYHVAGLEPGVTYYWRVDEVDGAGKVSTGAVWSFSSPSTKAYAPSPQNGGKYAPTDVKLTWTAGYGAVFHTVYFGTSFADVNTASGGKPQAETTYTPAGPLAKGTTYYWRVDEVGAPPASTVVKGSVWSFTTMGDIKITDPALIGWWPFDEGAGTKAMDFSGYGNDGTFGGGVKWVPGIMGSAIELANGYVAIDGVVNDIKSTNITLSAWIKTTQGGEGNLFAANDSTSGYALMFGIQGGNPYRWDTADQQFPPAVNNNEWHMLTYVRSGPTAYIYVDGALRATEATSFTWASVTRWSIGQEWDDSTPSDFYNGLVDDARMYNKGLSAGEVLDLMRGDPLLAWKPNPASGSTADVVKVAAGLTWSPGENAKQHDVYFGTDKAAVQGANASDKTGIYRGRQAAAGYTPTETLAWGTGPYYWRVDEVLADGTVTTGAVWSFSVADFLSVDDMESYDDDQNRIYDTWIDGYADQFKSSGSTVGNPTSPFAEMTIVHGGAQSMPMDYDNTKAPFFSEAVQTFAPLQDWTSNGVDTLSLWFRGVATNGAGKLYVAVEDSTAKKVVAANPDAAAVMTASWNEWKVPLSSFAGVNLAKVKKLYVGVGDRNAPVKGGAGRIFIDDIRLTKAPKAVTGPIDIPLAVAGDDVEEQTASGSVVNNSDLEMPFESAGTTIGTVPQVIGLRYTVPLAKGAKITKAYVEFTVDEIKGGTQVVNLVIDGQLSANASAFATTTTKDLTGRARTKAKVAWAVPNWTTVGAKSQSADISAILNEIISQGGWASGNAIVLIFADDPSKPSAGVRAADAFEDQSTNAGTAPVLHIEAQ